MSIKLIATTLNSAVLDVTLPVFIILLAIAYAEQVGWLDLERMFHRAGRGAPAVGAAISAFPGCAGGITMSRLYATGTISGAALFAGHLATMGDAAFVLWTGKPLQTLGLTLIVLALGAVLGFGSQRFANAAAKVAAEEADDDAEAAPKNAAIVWLVLLVASVLLGLFVQPIVGGIASVLLAAASFWAFRASAEDQQQTPFVSALQSAVQDASEITLWVIAADLIFVVGNAMAGGVISSFLAGNVAIDVVIAGLIGLIPGCGPQIIVATLFVHGDLPFAALLANTLSQHGDSIFPLLATQRRIAAYLSIAGGAVGIVAGMAWMVVLH